MDGPIGLSCFMDTPVSNSLLISSKFRSSVISFFKAFALWITSMLEKDFGGRTLYITLTDLGLTQIGQ